MNDQAIKDQSKTGQVTKKATGLGKIGLEGQGSDTDLEQKAPNPYNLGTPFVEKHLVESLDVESADPEKSVIFYNMLN